MDLKYIFHKKAEAADTVYVSYRYREFFWLVLTRS